MFNLQEKPSAIKREHPALQKMKFINYFIFFWLIFALLDPHPDCKSGSGYGSRDPIESGSDPDPQHCLPCQSLSGSWYGKTSSLG
jgi:hypothetical protein